MKINRMLYQNEWRKRNNWYSFHPKCLRFSRRFLIGVEPIQPINQSPYTSTSNVSSFVHLFSLRLPIPWIQNCEFVLFVVILIIIIIMIGNGCDNKEWILAPTSVSKFSSRFFIDGKGERISMIESAWIFIPFAFCTYCNLIIGFGSMFHRAMRTMPCMEYSYV